MLPVADTVGADKEGTPLIASERESASDGDRLESIYNLIAKPKKEKVRQQMLAALTSDVTSRPVSVSLLLSSSRDENQSPRIDHTRCQRRRLPVITIAWYNLGRLSLYWSHGVVYIILNAATTTVLHWPHGYGLMSVLFVRTECR